jgi:hypothetical protein
MHGCCVELPEAREAFHLFGSYLRLVYQDNSIAVATSVSMGSYTLTLATQG